MPIANTVNSKSAPLKYDHLYYQESFSVQELRFSPNRHCWVCTWNYWSYFNVEVKGHSLHMHRNGPCIHSIFYSIFRSIFRSIPHSVFYTLPSFSFIPTLTIGQDLGSSCLFPKVAIDKYCSPSGKRESCALTRSKI